MAHLPNTEATPNPQPWGPNKEDDKTRRRARGGSERGGGKPVIVSPHARGSLEASDALKQAKNDPGVRRVRGDAGEGGVQRARLLRTDVGEERVEVVGVPPIDVPLGVSGGRGGG